MKVIEQGYTVCFEKIVNLIKLLKTQEVQRAAGFRINRILRSDLLIIDEIGYTHIDRKEANLLFNLVSELYEKKSIITMPIPSSGSRIFRKTECTASGLKGSLATGCGLRRMPGRKRGVFSMMGSGKK
jgi:DNA replication protein DnaC